MRLPLAFRSLRCWKITKSRGVWSWPSWLARPTISDPTWAGSMCPFHPYYGRSALPNLLWDGLVYFRFKLAWYSTIHSSFFHLSIDASHPWIRGRIDGVVVAQVHGMEQQRLRPTRPTELRLGSRLSKQVASGGFVFQIISTYTDIIYIYIYIYM